MKDFSYPAQTGLYAVKVKNGAGWRAYRTARLQISVGGERHEGDKFRATTEWVAARFERVIVCVNDTLQRFNYIDKGMSEAQAFDASLEAGRHWLARHMDELSALRGLSIYRWEEWKQGEAFANAHRSVIDLYNSSQVFRDALADGMKNNLSRDYLLEEVAVFSLMYKAERAVDIYPGTLPKVMDIFEGQHTTRIDFARRKAA